MRRENAEVELAAAQTASEEGQTEDKAAIQAALTEQKQDLIDAIKALQRQLHEPWLSYEARHEIQEQIAAKKAAFPPLVAAAREEFSTMQTAAHADFTAVIETTTSDFAIASFSKAFAEAVFIAVARTSFEETAAYALESVSSSIQTAIDTVTAASEAKNQANQEAYEKLSHEISKIYDYHHKHRLQEALDAAKARADADCAAELASFLEGIEEVRQWFIDWAAVEALRTALALDTAAERC